MSTKEKSNKFSILLVTGATAIVVSLLAIGCYFLKEWMEEDAIWQKLVDYRHEKLTDDMTTNTGETVLELYSDETFQFYYTKEETGEKAIDALFFGVDFPDKEEDRALFMHQTAAIYLSTIEDLESCTVYWCEEMDDLSYSSLSTLFDTLDFEASIVDQVVGSGLLNYEKMDSMEVSREDIEDELEIANLYELSETKRSLKKLIKKQIPKIEMPEIE